nr:hypothetical protein [Tanacetum cinerariifolium]
MLHIFPRLPHQPFVEPPFKEEILAFLWFLRHSGVIRKLTDVNINKLHQPWRSFAAIINKCDDDEGKDGDDDEEDDGDDGEEGDGDEDDDGKEGDDDDDDQEVERDDEKDDEEEGGDDEQESNEEEFIHPSLSTHTKEEQRDKESFDPILKTPEDTDDEGNGEEDHGLNVGREEGYDEEEEEDELYKEQSSSVSSQFTPTSVAPLPMSVPTITPSTIAIVTIIQHAPTLPTTAPSTLLQDLPNFGSLFGFDNRLKTLEANFSEFMQTNQFAGAALVEAYESDKIILDTYGDTVMLKRRRDDDVDKDEEPSAGPAGGPRDAEKERSLSQQALQWKLLPGALASQYKGLNLDRCWQASLLQQRSQCRLPLRWKSPHIQGLKQRRVEDLQLGDKSYQKKLNLTKPDTYHSDLKRKEAYNAYSNPRGFIYQNKDKKNRLMWIDELHKFSDRTLIDIRTTLDDRLKGIRMQYLPQLIWRKSDKDRAAAMIQAIDKRLKTRRTMRSLERFIGGRMYEGDFGMLQRTI